MLLSFKKKRRLDATQRAQPPSPREAGLADSGLWVGSLRPFPERQPLERLCKCETPPLRDGVSVCECEESSAAFPKNAKPPQREPGGRISYRCRDSEGFDPKATETWGLLAADALRPPR